MKFKNGVTALLCTLNSENSVEGALSTISKSNPDQIIVADGGSRDRTIELAKKYTNDISVTEAGIARQIAAGLSRVKYKYLLFLEDDHRYPDRFISSLRKELEVSKFYGIQATLVCKLKRNYFEKGISCFYEIHQMKKGKKELIAGPAMYYSKIYISNIDISEFNGYSSDTRKGEIEKEKKLQIGLGKTVAYQYEPVTFKIFLKKFISYGRGDYDFFKFHKMNWSFNRKLKSIFHVFNRYIVDYPIKALFLNKKKYIPFFWLSAIVRYAGWANAILIHRYKKGDKACAIK